MKESLEDIFNFKPKRSFLDLNIEKEFDFFKKKKIVFNKKRELTQACFLYLLFALMTEAPKIIKYFLN